MRKQLTILMAVLAMLLALAGCGKMENKVDKVENEMDQMESQMAQKEELTAQERTQLYRTAIESARDEEQNSAFSIITSVDDDLGQATFDLLGLKKEDVEACALSASLMNVKAYGIAAVYPVAGREEAVRNGLNDYIANQKGSFHQYLQDQYDIASKAKLGTLKDGTILLVMCENQDQVYESIKTKIESGT